MWCVLSTGPSSRKNRALGRALLGWGMCCKPLWAARNLGMSRGSCCGPTEGGHQWNWFSFPFLLHSTQGPQKEIRLLWNTNPAHAEQRQFTAWAEIAPNRWLKGHLRSLGSAHFPPSISAAQNKLQRAPSGCDELHPAVLSQSCRGANISNGRRQMLLECVKIEKAKAS